MEIFNGFMDALNWANVIYVFFGVGLGVVVGCIPGLSGPIAIAMLIPLTYFMPPIGAIGFLVGINKGGCFGGSISAILLNTPGSPEATATTFDGYPMALKGLGLKAMKISLFSSVFGDVFSTLLVILVATSIASVALRLGPPEITAILILALLLIGLLESDSLPNGIIAACFGMLLSTIGLDSVSAMPRLTFGLYQLDAGLPVSIIGIGMLAMAELVRQSVFLKKELTVDSAIVEVKSDKKKNRLSLKELARLVPVWIRSSIIGSVIGACPGLGATVAAFLSYGIAKKGAKPGENYGEGEIKGIAAPETANNAVVGSALIPLFTLGIPGSVATSLLVGAFIVHGITPGPLMFEEHGRTVYGIYGSMLISCAATLILGYAGIHAGVKILEVPKRILNPIILFTCLIGAFIIQQEEFDVYVVLIFAVVGFFLRIAKLSFVALIIGFVLGKVFETSIQQTLIASEGDITVLFTRPISGIIMLISCCFLAWMAYGSFKKSKSE